MGVGEYTHKYKGLFYQGNGICKTQNLQESREAVTDDSSNERLFLIPSFELSDVRSWRDFKVIYFHTCILRMKKQRPSVFLTLSPGLLVRGREKLPGQCGRMSLPSAEPAPGAPSAVLRDWATQFSLARRPLGPLPSQAPFPFCSFLQTASSERTCLHSAKH